MGGDCNGHHEIHRAARPIRQFVASIVVAWR
jgi:hypothetical protein